jgi:Transposase DDE domain group 1
MIWLQDRINRRQRSSRPPWTKVRGFCRVCQWFAGKPVHLTFDGGLMTSDTGILLLAAVEQRLGIAERLADCIEDPRAPERVRHTLAEMIRYRALLIAAGYPDGNDCDALCADPAFKMAVGRLPESGDALCSQPTISRLETCPARPRSSG